ncbi:MAG: class A beta-lactamase-related serine hydrolase [Chloroflexota bacterium]|nr:MAG: class A beta-lactamase-related serine hydrolase [Chloroflexota bacterium]
MNRKHLNCLIILALLAGVWLPACSSKQPMGHTTTSWNVEPNLAPDAMIGQRPAPKLAQPLSEEARFEEIDAYVQREMKRANIPGLAYGIVYRDQIVHMQAFGVADDDGRPVTVQTPFQIGSVAKTFTALAIRQLVNDGKVKLDAPVQGYIPWFRLADPEAASSITIRQLILQTSGLSQADGNRAIFFDERYSIEELVRMMDQIRPNRPVGSSSEYCNLNYLVLGQVIQEVSGQPFAEYIQTNILQPLEMEHSYLSEAEAVHDGLATGYHIWYGFPVPMQADFPQGAAAQGYMISSVEDMAQYLVAYLNRGWYRDVSVLLPASSTAATVPANWYDIHWSEYFDSDAIYSDAWSGGTYNFNSAILIMGEQSQGTYGVVLLLNTRPDYLVESVNSITLIDGIRSLLLNGKVEKSSPWAAIEWYFWWGVADLVLLVLVLLALFELITFRKWAFRTYRTVQPSRHIFFVRTGADLLAGVFALVALPAWQDLPWRDLLKPYCELCPILLSTGTILVTVAVTKIGLSLIGKWRPLKTALVSLVLLTLVLAGARPLNAQASAPMQTASYDQIDAYVQSEMKAASIPGLAYGIVKGDQIVHLQAFGSADATGRPITPQTPFLIGSVGKVITSLAIQQLVSAGKVDLDAPVQRYIPWFRLADEAASSQITIRHLLNHTSGLSAADGAKPKYYLVEGYTNQEIIHELDQSQPDRPVGSSFEYSNLNFLILGHVIEQVSGQTYEDYIQEHIFGPLEMKHSYMDLTEAQQAGLVLGNRVLFGFLFPVQLPYPRAMMSSGFHFSTVEDLAHLLIAHLNQGRYADVLVLPQNSNSTQVVASKPGYYDIHWIGLNEMPRNYTDAQSGTTLDYSACYYILPNHRTGVVVLTNANTAEATPTKSAQTIAFDILEMSTGFSTRSDALPVKTVYIWIDLILLGGVALGVVQILGLRRWKNKMGSRIGHSWLAFLPAFLIDIALPLGILAGLPLLIPPLLIQGLSIKDAWPLFGYVMPDVTYTLLAIAGLLLAAGFIKLLWFLGLRRPGVPTNKLPGLNG